MRLFHAHPRDDQDNEDKQAHPSVRPRKLSSHCIFCSPGSFDSIHTLPDNYNRFAGLPQAPHGEYSIEKSEKFEKFAIDNLIDFENGLW